MDGKEELVSSGVLGYMDFNVFQIQHFSPVIQIKAKRKKTFLIN